MLSKDNLEKLYSRDGLSMQQVASQLGCSVNKVVYWMDKYGMKRRSVSDAIYQLSNPNGDPFKIKKIASIEDAYLLGLGIGIYWGEGNKRNKHSVRLGNTDPDLIATFIRFLTEICGIRPEKLRFGLQIFSDMDPEEALNFWIEYTGFGREQFHKATIVTPARSIGTYREKTKHGVLTVHFHNYKLRDIIVSLCRDSSVGRAHPWWVVESLPIEEEMTR